VEHNHTQASIMSEGVTLEFSLSVFAGMIPDAPGKLQKTGIPDLFRKMNALQPLAHHAARLIHPLDPRTGSDAPFPGEHDSRIEVLGCQGPGQVGKVLFYLDLLSLIVFHDHSLMFSSYKNSA
jgi:hypothetical protein